MEGSGFFRFQNRLSSAWSYNNNNASADQEVDLTLRLGLPDENQEAPTQGVMPQNFSNNINIPRFHHQVYLRIDNKSIFCKYIYIAIRYIWRRDEIVCIYKRCPHLSLSPDQKMVGKLKF